MPAASESICRKSLPNLPRFSFPPHCRPLSLTLVCVMTIAIIAAVFTPRPVAAQPTKDAIERLDLNRPATKFLTGRKLDIGNRAAVSVDWTGVNLRTRITQFSQARKVAIFLDRNIDSQANQSFSIRDASAEQVIWKLAETHQIGACRVGSWYYLGPENVAASLPSQIERLKQTTRRNRDQYKVAWNRSNAFKTDAIFEPKQWLANVAEEYGFEITNLDVLPHDLWLGIEMPSMSLDEKVQLMLVGFGLSFQRNKAGDAITLVPFQSEEPITREIAIPSSVKSSQYDSLILQIKQGIEDVSVTRKGKRLSISGSAPSVLAAVARVVERQTVSSASSRSRKKSEAVTTQDAFTLSVTAARGSILASVAKQTSRELAYPPELRSKLQTAITIAVENATVAEIVEATLDGSTLKAEISQTQIRIMSR